MYCLCVEKDKWRHWPKKIFLCPSRIRWIKFEENLLEGAERWGKPHVASLAFHSVINLRQIIDDQCTSFLGGGGSDPCAYPPPWPSIFSDYSFSFFSDYSFCVHHPLTGRTGNSLHMQWPLTQSHDSFLKESNCFFVTDETPRPYDQCKSLKNPIVSHDRIWVVWPKLEAVRLYVK
jgi:hypothetical protein